MSGPRSSWWPIVGVRRDRAARFLFITIVAFSVTVLATRLYLDWSGYPTLGGGGLHVAHMLWGGLLLVVAILLVQLVVGRRALLLASLAAGVGVGLFIDEIGKFLTESNDYFFAPAAPIIYGTVLLLVLLWLVVRRDDRPTSAEAVHGAIEALGDLADGRLSASDRDRAVGRLRSASAPAGPTCLAAELLELLDSPEASARLTAEGLLEPGQAERLLERLVPDRLERLLVRVGLLVSVVGAALALLIASAAATDQLAFMPRPSGPIEFPEEPVWVVMLAVVWIVVGACSAVALALSLAGRHERAMTIALAAVLVSVVAGGLLNTYVSQVGALSGVIVQVGLLALVVDQRRRIAGGSQRDRPEGVVP